MPSPLRVVMVVPSLVVGGAETFAVSLSERLLARGLDVHLVAISGSGPLEARLSAALRARFVVLGKRHRWDASVLLRTVGLLRGLRPDVVHTHLFTALSWGGTAARLSAVPLVVHTQHAAHEEQGYVARVDRVLCRRVDHLVCCSEAAEALMRSKGYAPARCTVIENGIDTADRPRASLDGHPFVVGTVGRLVPVKGQRHLVDAVGDLVRRGFDLRLVLVGDGPERAALEARAGEQALGGRFEITGEVDDVARRLAGFDLFALPSLSEAMPLAQLEAAAAGLPLLVTSAGGASRLVDRGAGGWVVPPADFPALARAIETCIGLPLAERRALGARARSVVEGAYGLDGVADRYRAVYEQSRAPQPAEPN